MPIMAADGDNACSCRPWQARRLLDLLIDGLKYRCDPK
jgi:hypothetical protein